MEWGRGVLELYGIGWHIIQGGRGGVGAGCSGVVRHWVAHKTRGRGGVGAGCSGVVRHWVAHKTRGRGGVGAGCSGVVRH